MPIADIRTTRLTAWAALGVALLYLISTPIGSLASLPAADASGATVARFFADHREGLLVALALNGVAWCALMPCAFAGLRSLFGERGGSAATVALVCAGVEAALIGVALTFGAIVAYDSPNLSPQLAKTLGDGFALATSASAWPTVPCVVALIVAARRSEALSRPVLGVAVLVAALHVIAGVAFARSGAFSPSGIALAAPPAFAILMACVGVTLLRAPRPAVHPAAHAGTALSASAGRS